MKNKNISVKYDKMITEIHKNKHLSFDFVDKIYQQFNYKIVKNKIDHSSEYINTNEWYIVKFMDGTTISSKTKDWFQIINEYYLILRKQKINKIVNRCQNIRI